MDNHNNGKIKAVLDRIVDGEKAVLLVGEEEQERIVDVAELPNADGQPVKEGSWLIVDETGALTYDSEESEQRAESMANKLAMLQKRSRPSRFQKE